MRNDRLTPEEQYDQLKFAIQIRQDLRGEYITTRVQMSTRP